MGLLDAYEDSANTALKVMDSRPVELEKPKPKNSAWSAPLRAVAAAGAEVLGNVVDTAAAAGQVAASVGGITPGFDDQKNRQQSIDAMDTLKTEGINWRTEEGQQAYKFGADLRPDPLTAGTAENLVFSLTKGLTKAIGAAATLGPVAGAAAFGGSEGMTASEDLATQGVDLETRAKVGLVTAGFNAAGVALPVAGQTLKQTAALVALGGPASFMAQQQATRSILESADYGEIAQQYDPLDPVGLTVSTLLPAGFAAYAKRGGFGKPAVPQEAVDAAMVQNLTIARDVHQDTPPQKFEAELWRGPVTENSNFKTWFSDSKVVSDDGKPLIVYHGTASEFDAFDSAKSGSSIDSGKLGEGFYFSSSPAWASAYAGNAAKSGDGAASVMPVYLSIKNPLVLDGPGTIWTKLEEFSQEWGIWQSPVIDDGMRPNPEWSKVFRAEAERRGFDGVFLKSNSEYVAFHPEQIKSAIGNSGKFDPKSPSLTDQIEPPKVAEAQTPDAYQARIDALLKDQPDIVSRLDDSGQPVKLSDELAAIKKEAQEGTDTEFGSLDAPLLKVAAECALSIGTAGL